MRRHTPDRAELFDIAHTLEQGNDAAPALTAMAYTINTHDAWGIVRVGSFESLDQARKAFAELCQDPWYLQDGGVRGLELAQEGNGGASQRLEWFALR